MAASKKFTVTISGGGVHDVLREVIEYEMLGLPASTYVKLKFADGRIAFYNDFGVRHIIVEESK